MGTHADSDDIENDEDDDDLWQSSPIALTDAQAKIAAAALETMLVAEDSTSEDEREEVRRRRFHLILDEAVRRAEASCDESGARSASCVTAWEEVSEVRDAASRAGVRVAGEGEASGRRGEGFFWF